MDETFSFLVHSVRLINTNKANEDDLNFLFELLLSIEDDIILKFSTNISIPKLGYDYKLFYSISNFLLKHYEENEEYEKCSLLVEKLEYSKKLIEQNSPLF
jgi:hypothetical protein